MSRPIITLTTDFGASSPYVGQMKGAILAINPEANLIDLTHTVKPQDIAQAARTLAQSALIFPVGSIHLCVVDPGVGTDRKIIFAEIEGHRFITPDNGCLTVLATRFRPSTIVAIENRDFFREQVSATFHGRDIMGPVAAHLSLGVSPGELGPPKRKLITVQLPEATVLANKIEGEVVSIDSFGNLITNISADQLENVPRNESTVISCDSHETMGIYDTYGDQPPMTLIALVGSSGMLELAIVEDSAKIMLGIPEGTKVSVSW